MGGGADPTVPPMSDSQDTGDNRNARAIGLGIVFPLALAGGVFALSPGWPAVIVGAPAIVAMALTAGRLAAERSD